MASEMEMQMWPKLNLEYLEPEQIEHEAYIRNMPVTRNMNGTYSPASIRRLQNEISTDPYAPWTVGQLRVDSQEERERQAMEFKRCKAGLGSLEGNQVSLDSPTILQRTLHFVFRLERLQLLDLNIMEKKLGLRKKGRDIINRCLNPQPRNLNMSQPQHTATNVTHGNSPPIAQIDMRHTSLLDLSDHETDENQAGAKVGNMTTHKESRNEIVNSQTGAYPKRSSNPIQNPVVESQGLEHILNSFLTNFKQEFDRRLSALEVKQLNNNHSSQSNDANLHQMPTPSGYGTLPPHREPIRPSVIRAQEWNPQPISNSLFNHVSQPEQQFIPPLNSTYHHGMNSRPRREDDNNTFRKIDALSKWRLCFNGTTIDEKHLALNDYIISIERFIKLQRINPDDVLPYLLPTLSGNARIWYNAEGGSIDTLQDFFKGLRENFDYKQNPTDVMAAVLQHKFDPERERLITHINKLECEMANCNIPLPTQLELVLKTLPENLRMMAATRDVKNLMDLRKWALKLFPPTIGEVKTKRKEFRRFDDKRKSVLALNISESESSGKEESESDDETMQQVCEFVRKMKSKPDFKPRGKPTFPKPKREEPVPRPQSQSNDLTIDTTRIEGDDETICFQCRLYGHNFHDCSAPRRYPFCYDCGRPGVQSRFKCPSPSCVVKRETKNA